VAAFCALTFAATALFSASTFFRVGPPEDQLPSLIAAAQSGAGLVGTDEYAPPGADNSTVAMGLPDACLVDHFDDELGKAQDPETNPRWSAVQGSCYATAAATVRQPQTLRLNLTSARNGFLILRLRSYPAWRIQVNGRVVDKLPARGDGLMAVPVQRGPVDLSVHWIRTSDVLVGRGLSCMAAILLLGLGWLERRAARPIGASSGEPEVR